ncbi:MAG: hypothetical protein WDN69_24155 [Aliidongia sp.]
MTGDNRIIALTVFALTIVLAFGFSALGRVRERQGKLRTVSAQGLNRVKM